MKIILREIMKYVGIRKNIQVDLLTLFRFSNMAF